MAWAGQAKKMGGLNFPLTGYTVVRYIPDLGRNEPRNVGIIVWNKDSFLVRFDGAALYRLIGDYPDLTITGLRTWETYLLSHLREAEPTFSASWMMWFLANSWMAEFQVNVPSFLPISLSEARYTTVVDEGLEATLERLMERLVRWPS